MSSSETFFTYMAVFAISLWTTHGIIKSIAYEWTPVTSTRAPNRQRLQGCNTSISIWLERRSCCEARSIELLLLGLLGHELLLRLLRSEWRQLRQSIDDLGHVFPPFDEWMLLFQAPKPCIIQHSVSSLTVQILNNFLMSQHPL